MRRRSLLLSLAACVCAQTAAPPALKPGLYAIFDTSMGSVTALLYEKDTPIAVRNFTGLASGTTAWRDPATKAMVHKPLYDRITFHRVLRGTMIQAGDPTGAGNWPCGVNIRDEILPGLRFDRAGRLATANTGAPDSGGCQFFITDTQTPQWNGAYTIFGQVVDGQDVVSKIARVPLHGEKPAQPVMLNSVSIERIGPEPAKKK